MKIVHNSCRLWTTRLLLLGFSALVLAWSPFAQAVQSVTLAWDRSTDSTVTGYRIYYTDVAAGSTNTINAGNVLSGTVPGLLESKTYSFYVVSYNASSVESVPSNVIGYTVPSANTAPTISSIADRSISQNTSTGPIAFTVGDSQTAAGSLTVSAVSSNPTLVPAANIVFGGSGASRTVTITPAANLTGTATVTVSVSDGALTASDSFVLTVSSVANTAPTISNIADLSTSQNTATAPIAFTVGDSQTAAGSLTVSAVSSNPTLVPVANIVFGGSGANRTVSIIPALNLSGTATITVTVSDGSLTASDSFVLTVNAPANTAPTISNIADLSTSQNTATAPIAFTVGDSQTAAGSLTVSAVSSNPTLVPAANIVLGGSGANRTVSITPAANLTGTATITVTVSDGSLTASDSFVLTVNAPANTAPTISSIADQTTTQNTATAPIAFTIGDSQTAAGSLTVSAVSSNPTLAPAANIVLGGSGANRTVTITPANLTGTATITVTVSDGSLTASRSFVLTVNATAPFTPVYMAIEAESASLVAPMAVLNDQNASGGKYIAPTADESGTATFTLNVSVAGTYVIWCKVLSPDLSQDSFYVSVDGGTEFLYATAFNKWANTWQWTAMNALYDGIDPMTFQFAAGTHTVVIRGREAGTGLDQLLVTNDRSYTPDVIFTITAPPPLIKSTIKLDPAGFVTVSWPAVAGKSYRIMYKNKLTDSTWTSFHPDVKPTGNTGSKSDYLVGNRFYQVVELP